MPISFSDHTAHMKKVTRTQLTDEQINESKRLKAIYNKRKDEARDRGERLTQDAVADACGWTGQSAVSQYLNGRIALNLEALVKLSVALNFEPEEVSERLAIHIKAHGYNNTMVSAPPSLMYKYPVLEWGDAARWAEIKGRGMEKEYMETEYQAPNNEAFWLKVKGDSMTGPTGQGVPDGAMILVITNMESKPDDLVVAKLPGRADATFRKLIEDGGQRYLKPLNPAFPLTEFDDSCELIGVVKRAVQMF